jgi:trehalose synthase
MIHEIRGLCRQLHGVRVLHINSTAVGGGVAELLYSIVPLEVECGLEAEWRLLAADPKPFDVTKAFHNGLQGQKVGLSDADLQLYLRENEHSAQLLNPADYDVIVVHDPQPAALPHFVSLNQDRWVWRCHIDSSAPDPDVWRFLRPFVEVYDSAIFTRREFAPWDLAGPTLNVIAPEGRHGYPADLDNTHDRPRASHP